MEGDVSAEVIATDLRGMVKEGERLASLAPEHRGESADDPRWREGIEAFQR